MVIPYLVFDHYWALFEAVNGLVIAVLSALDIYSLFKHRIDRAPLAQWALNLRSSKRDMNIILFASALFVLVFITYAFGSIYGEDIIKIAADLLGTVTYLMVSYVIVRWSRIFVRFLW